MGIVLPCALQDGAPGGMAALRGSPISEGYVAGYAAGYAAA